MGSTHFRSDLREHGERTASITNIQTASLNADTVQLNLGWSDGAQEGRLQWNSTDGTMEYGLPGGNVTLQVGQEMVLRCLNKTATDITNGMAVRVTGAQGNRPTIAPAKADSILTLGAIGLVTEDVAVNETGYVTTFGYVRDIDTSHVTAGSVLYLSPDTAGAFTAQRPVAPDLKMYMGLCIMSNVDNGVVAVTTEPITRRTALSDTLETPPTVNGQHYEWNTANTRFELKKPFSYGEIYAYNNATAVNVATAGTYYQITDFHANGAAYDTVASWPEAHIRVTRSGVYNAQVSMTVKTEGGAGAVVVDTDLKKNNGTTSFNNVHAHRRLAGGGADVGSVSLSGLVTLATNDTVEVWIANETDTFNLIVEDINLSIHQIGGN